MAEIKDILAFIIRSYPSPEHLTKTRATKLVYLSDWKHCIVHDSQITNIEWSFDNFGPFAWDVTKSVEQNPAIFTIQQEYTFFGNPKSVWGLKEIDYRPKLSEQEIETVGFVLRATKKLNMEEFLKVIYSTFPIVSSERGDKLDLVECAKKYRGTLLFKTQHTDAPRSDARDI